MQYGEPPLNKKCNIIAGFNGMGKTTFVMEILFLS